MGISFYVKRIAAGAVFGATFMDCVGYVARVEGEKMNRTSEKWFEFYILLGRYFNAAGTESRSNDRRLCIFI